MHAPAAAAVTAATTAAAHKMHVGELAIAKKEAELRAWEEALAGEKEAEERAHKEALARPREDAARNEDIEDM